MLMLSYNEAMDMEVIDILTECGINNYTKLMGTFGKGTTSGTHLGNDIWPGKNNMLYIACSEEECKKLLSHVRELRKQLGHEGIKAFAWNLEEIT